MNRSVRATWTFRDIASGSASRFGPAPASLLALKSLDTEEDSTLAREWVKGFTVEDIPKSSYTATYSRSSGPGGQHVNTTDSKATVRMPIHRALGVWLPRYMTKGLIESSHFTHSSQSLLFSASLHRSAPANLTLVLSILHAHLVSVASSPIRGETSSAQRQRVDRLKARDRLKRYEAKERQKRDKSWRRGE
ncbi:hypothetical protein BD324DRAFT_639967 [Kockovaella imperatae]|uniref:Prokaryotic-type class I peptide chain release factors domain-containing protein n=1 Tax=Kockovaella imperatae TaxID=4999 RepID=A0A1Y1U5U3_9TREE|nr:hypothetical protein BD324DRAFT_639967 [Kockovaella imperatae]ORX33398.1 hypothetical protein BD324DRAFT_639967 [Kockovaella imperatae]